MVINLAKFDVCTSRSFGGAKTHIHTYISKYRQNCALCISSSYLVFIQFCRLNGGGRMHASPSATARTPFLHLSRLRASSFFKPLLSVSSSTRFFQVFFGCPHFRLPLISRSRATLKTLSSSFLRTCPYYLKLYSLLLAGL